MQDQWNLNQYEKFKTERYRPFYDLLALIKPENLKTAIDLGCGAGELTLKLHQTLKLESTLGIDSSANMLSKASQYQASGLSFKEEAIEQHQSKGTYDLVFSHATLQWLDDHQTLIPKISSWVAPQGQLAIQVPSNFDHLSHTLARDLALSEFQSDLLSELRTPSVLKLEDYGQLLYQLGYQHQRIREEIYGNVMESGKDVIEWVKGTLFTDYKKRLTAEAYLRFEQRYTEELLKRIGTGKYFYGFKRTLIWGEKEAY